MRVFTSRRSRSFKHAGPISLAVAGIFLFVAQSAHAATWGHLRSPFSAESEATERANFAAEERSIHSEHRNFASASLRLGADRSFRP
jgi:hypothetical protein